MSFLKILPFVLKKESSTGLERHEGVNMLFHILELSRARHKFKLNLKVTQIGDV